jgi:hypothetical protein
MLMIRIKNTHLENGTKLVANPKIFEEQQNVTLFINNKIPCLLLASVATLKIYISLKKKVNTFQPCG